MRYRSNGGRVVNDRNLNVATILGVNQKISHKLARICVDALNAEEVAKENSVVQAKIDAKQHEVEVLDKIVACFDCAPI